MLPGVLLSALLLVAGWGAQPALALSEQEVDQRVQAISDQLRCPTCQGISVRDSEASFSRQIRDKVRRMVREGQDEEAIKAFFVSRYGEWILRAPKKEGFGLVLWLLPGLLIVLGGGWIGYRLYLGSRAPPGEQNAVQCEELTPEQRQRIENDLRRFEEQD